jgi:beta-glucanase (GH16 family)
MLFSDHFQDLDNWHLPLTFFEPNATGLQNRLPNCYDPDNVTLNNGAHIRAERNVDSYVTGWMDTKTKHAFTYGYFEARLRFPAVPGLWAGFFLVNENGYPPEIDSGEILTNDGSLRFAVRQGQTDYRLSCLMGEALLGNWHTFGVLWEVDKIVWYIDGREYWHTTQYIPSMPMNLFITMGMGEWQAPNDALLPAMLDIDYVEVWKK